MYDHTQDDYTDADFMYKESDGRKYVINALKDMGYNAMVDPLDSWFGIGYEKTATIFIDDVLERYGTYPLNGAYSIDD